MGKTLPEARALTRRSPRWVHWRLTTIWCFRCGRSASPHTLAVLPVAHTRRRPRYTPHRFPCNLRLGRAGRRRVRNALYSFRRLAAAERQCKNFLADAGISKISLESASKYAALNEKRGFRMTRKPLLCALGRGGIEPPTPGFSVLCSTN